MKPNAILIAAMLLVVQVPEVAAQSLTSKNLGPYKIKVEKSVFVPMKDGVKLSTDIYMPEGASAKLPVILIRTPYGKRVDEVVKAIRFFASHGYVGVIQDLRGKEESEGRFFAYQDEGPDGAATLDWLIKQPWSNGAVGTYGCSYLGEVQEMLARLRHPAHKAAVIQGSSAYKGSKTGVRILAFSNNGVIEQAASLGWNRESGGQRFAYGPPASVDRQQWFQSDASRLYAVRPTVPKIDVMAALRTLPSADVAKTVNSPPSFYEDWLQHAPFDRYFDRIGGVEDDDRFAVPALHVSSWYDYNFSPRHGYQSYSRNGVTDAARNGQQLILGPGTHCQFLEGEDATSAVVGERAMANVQYDYLRHYLDWYGYWLKGEQTKVLDRPKVQIFVMGENRWRAEPDWPIRRAVSTSFYLASDGRANSRFGDGALVAAPPAEAQPDRFVYDPAYPTPSRGGLICCTGDFGDEGGAKDQAELQLRNDVLVYQTPPLTQPIEITGPVEVELYVSSDAPDTDFTAKLSEVDASGKIWILTDGIMRMRYRDGLDHRATRMEPGKVYKIRIGLEATSIQLPPGNRLSLEISSSSFPRWERNLNTGGNNYDETVPRRAGNAVYHTAMHPSRIVVPIVPTAAAGETPRK